MRFLLLPGANLHGTDHLSHLEVALSSCQFVNRHHCESEFLVPYLFRLCMSSSVHDRLAQISNNAAIPRSLVEAG